MQIELAQFTGPLDALLSMVEGKELDISDLSLSNVTEQYLQYIESLDETNPEELADFLVIATRLLLLKSKALLPQLLPEEEDGPSLTDQLKLYKAFKDASKFVEAQWLNPHVSFERIEPVRRPKDIVPPENATTLSLHEAMHKLVVRLKPPKPLPKTTIDRTVSMKAKISHIRTLLKTQKKAAFFEVIAAKQNKTDVIVSFLALLELVKQRTVTLTQDDHFADIMIVAE